ncbi:MAG: glycerophosphodiester phosphodiesterase [Chitinophagaceae bacterium]|nr:glycerophosphodiester phosphodiesterase [Chitinophagaceae bacterium]
MTSTEISFAKNPVVAHRGAFKKNGFPENSIASLKEAIRLGCTGSEFDVRMSADDSLLVNHDPHHNGLDIEKTGFAELRRFPLANGEPLPLLRSYLREGMDKNTRTRLVLEIKPSVISKERGVIIARKVFELVKEMKAEALTVYISFDYGILQELRRLDPQASLQYLEGDKSPAQLKAEGINGADYHYSVFKKNPHWIKEAKAHGILLNAWTVNDKETMEWLLKEGFDFITTNEPETLLVRLAD